MLLHPSHACSQPWRILPQREMALFSVSQPSMCVDAIFIPLFFFIKACDINVTKCTCLHVFRGVCGGK